MKRIFLAIVILFVAGVIVYAQQGAPTKQEMQNYLSEVQSKTSEYDSMLEDIISRNASSGEIHQFLRLKGEINRLDQKIQSEINSITAIHDKDNKVSSQIIDSLQRSMNERKARQQELENLLSN